NTAVFGSFAMRQFSIVLLACLLSGSVLAQQASRGKIKSIDLEKGVVTITTADGKDLDGALTPQTLIHDANNQTISDFRQKGLPAGTNVMFRTEQRGDRLVLTGLKVPGTGGGQTKAGGQKAEKSATTQANVPPPRDSIGAKPLTELGNETYKGQSG